MSNKVLICCDEIVTLYKDYAKCKKCGDIFMVSVGNVGISNINKTNDMKIKTGV